MGAAGLTDAAGGHVVAAAGSGPSGGPVKGFHERLCQMALRAEAPQSVEFFRG